MLSRLSTAHQDLDLPDSGQAAGPPEGSPEAADSEAAEAAEAAAPSAAADRIAGVLYYR